MTRLMAMNPVNWGSGHVRKLSTFSHTDQNGTTFPFIREMWCHFLSIFSRYLRFNNVGYGRLNRRNQRTVGVNAGLIEAVLPPVAANRLNLVHDRFTCRR